MLQHPLGPGTLLVMVCETPLAERLTAVLDELEVAGYTRFSGVSGIGATGRHEGTAVWPGTNTVIFTFVPSSEAVAEILRRNEEDHRRDLWSAPGLPSILFGGRGAGVTDRRPLAGNTDPAYDRIVRGLRSCPACNHYPARIICYPGSEENLL